MHDGIDGEAFPLADSAQGRRLLLHDDENDVRNVEEDRRKMLSPVVW